ncbi:MAG TPA: hypothetical protein VML54_17560, partial [Candidatus Limnocylindrales bacterium]|nr:hypothetical protein [Candidatus Limnocylindrales bacterium]
SCRDGGRRRARPGRAVRIAGLAREETGETVRVAADVIWEDTERAPRRIHFETTEPFGAALTASPHAFLTAAIVPALRAGEARVAIEGAVCPQLRDGLTTVMQVLNRWWGPARRLVAIEPRDGFCPAVPPTPTRTGMFLSGGFDSLTTLRENRRSFPLDHPAAVRDALFVYGFDMGGPGDGDQTAFFEASAAALGPVAAETQVELIPVRTNLRELDPDGAAWPDEWFGSAAAAVAHAFSTRLSEVLIAASLDIKSLEPIGSHPLLDPSLSSAGLRVIHHGAHLSRLQKIRTVAQWDTALASVRVCWAGIQPGGPLNCGRCRKCLRAMLGLLVIGKLAEARSFPVREITPAMLEPARIDNAHLLGFYRELLDPLRTIGRDDLRAVIERKIGAFERSADWARETGVKGTLRRLDRTYLGGVFLRLARRVG